MTIAAAVAVGGAVLLVALGGVLTVTAGLLVVAGFVGWGVGQAIARARGSIAAGRRVAFAVTLAIAAIALAQAGLWLYAQTEGGRLALLDYLGQTWGALIPLQALIAAAAAWWAAR